MRGHDPQSAGACERPRYAAAACVRKVYIDLDIDRQNITVFGKPEEVDAHILNCVRTLGSPNGGLKFIWGVYPGTPYENIEAVIRAMDRYATYWDHR